MSNGIKQGDTVRVSKDAPKIYAKGWLHDWCNTDSIVKEVDNEDAVIAPITRANDELAIPCKYIVKVDGEYRPKFKKGDKVRLKKVYTVVSVDDGQVFIDSAGNHIDEDCLELYIEPTEQTEAEKKPNVGSIKIPVEVELSDSYWGAYAADLAKEVAVKIANKYNDPEQAAEYAVSVAKAVAEGLKRK